MRSEFFLHDDQEWAIQSMRKMRATQQWLRYVLNWPIALNALRQLWATGKVSEMKSPFWEPSQKTANQ